MAPSLAPDIGQATDKPRSKCSTQRGKRSGRQGKRCVTYLTRYELLLIHGLTAVQSTLQEVDKVGLFNRTTELRPEGILRRR